MKKIFLALFLSSSIIFVLSCQKNYTLGPVPQPTPTSTPTPLPACNNPPYSLPCSSGIMWGTGQILDTYYSNGSDGYYAELTLAVNCTPYTTAGVTLTGPGLTLPLTYGGGTINLGGTNYADYMSAFSTGIIPGDTYTLTSVTTSGTAYASLVLPPIGTVSSDGLIVTWPGPSIFNLVAVNEGSNNIYHSSICYSASSPASIPSSAYPVSDTYTTQVECINYSTSITGGSGIYFVAETTEQLITKSSRFPVALCQKNIGFKCSSFRGNVIPSHLP